MLVLSAGHVAAQNPLVSEGTSGPGRGKHIVFLAGDHSFWALGMEKAITPALEISFVGPYRAAGDPEGDTEIINSTWSSVFLSASFLWSTPLSDIFAIEYGIDPIHFGVVFVVNMEIGYLMPPVATNLFVGAAIFRTKLMHGGRLMKHRRVFSTVDILKAQEAVAAARHAGALDEDISLVARSDIEMQLVPDKRHDVSMDMAPAAVRGALGGGGMGLLAGLLAMVIPPLGITVAGAALFTITGALVGSWSGALVGSAIPSEVRRKFEDEIEAGRVLVVIDVVEENIAAIEAAVQSTGARELPYDSLTAVS